MRVIIGSQERCWRTRDLRRIDGFLVRPIDGRAESSVLHDHDLWSARVEVVTEAASGRSRFPCSSGDVGELGDPCHVYCTRRDDILKVDTFREHRVPTGILSKVGSQGSTQ